MDFKKLLWEQRRIKYGKKWIDYEPWPRQWKTRGITDDKIIPISLSLNIQPDKVWVQVEEGGVTGYESAALNSLWFNQSSWCANAGGMGYYRLDIMKKDLIPVLRGMRNYLQTVRR